MATQKRQCSAAGMLDVLHGGTVVAPAAVMRAACSQQIASNLVIQSESTSTARQGITQRPVRQHCAAPHLTAWHSMRHNMLVSASHLEIIWQLCRVRAQEVFNGSPAENGEAWRRHDTHSEHAATQWEHLSATTCSNINMFLSRLLLLVGASHSTRESTTYTQELHPSPHSSLCVHAAACTINLFDATQHSLIQHSCNTC